LNRFSWEDGFPPIPRHLQEAVVNRPPRPSCEELDPRFERLRATGDIRIRNALVEDYSWLASFCASRFAHRGEPRDDLVQVALVGLVNAVNRFDPARELSFSTFAVPTIEGELRRYFRDKTWTVHVTRRVKDAGRAVASAVDDLTSTLGRTPTAAEIAARTSLRPEDVLQVLDLHILQRGVPLEQQASEEDAHEGAALGVVDGGFESAEARTVLADLLRALPTRRDRLIIQLRFVEGYTQSEIARTIGVSQVQVSRLLRTNLERMRRTASRQGRRAPVGSM
jgi:RNA polymerase sigma-B factor